MSKSNSLTLKWSPIITWLAGLAFVTAAVLGTPHFLIRSGLLSGSLANVDPEVRTFGHVAVIVVRILAGVVGGCVLVAGLSGFFGKSEKGTGMAARRGAPHNGDGERVGAILNQSFGLMFLVWMGVILLVVFGQNFFGRDEYLRINRVVVPLVAGMGFLIAAGLGCGLSLRMTKVGGMRAIGCFTFAAGMGAIGFEILKMVGLRGTGGILFGRVATDMLTILILGFFVAALVLRSLPPIRRSFDGIGVLIPSVGLALGTLFAVTVSTPVMEPVWGMPSGTETGFLRLILLSAGAIFLMGETSRRIPASGESASLAETVRAKVGAPG